MNAGARKALHAALPSNGAPEATIPRHVSAAMRACLVAILHAGGLDRGEERKIYNGHTHRRRRWFVRGTNHAISESAVNGLIHRGLAIALMENERRTKTRLTLMGHWFAETLDAQWQRGEFQAGAPIKQAAP